MFGHRGLCGFGIPCSALGARASISKLEGTCGKHVAGHTHYASISVYKLFQCHRPRFKVRLASISHVFFNVYPIRGKRPRPQTNEFMHERARELRGTNKNQLCGPRFRICTNCNSRAQIKTLTFIFGAPRNLL